MEITTISFWPLLVGCPISWNLTDSLWNMAGCKAGHWLFGHIAITGLVSDHTRNLATYHSERHQPQGTGLGLVARRWHFRHTDRFLACQQSGSKQKRIKAGGFIFSMAFYC